MTRQDKLQSLWIKTTIWLLVSFFFAYQYIIRVLPSIMMQEVTHKFHMTPELLGHYSGIYYMGYAGLHIPLGVWLERYGPKRVLPLCVLLSVGGLLPLLWANHWVYPILGRFLSGVGSSAAILGVFQIVRLIFPHDRFALFLGYSVMIGLLGAIYGGGPLHYCIERWGWEWVLQGIIGIGVILALAIYSMLPQQPIAPPEKIWHHFRAVCRPMFLMVCLLAGLMVGPLEGFADAWGKAYLLAAYPFSESAAAFYPSLIFLGMCVGSPLLGWLSVKTQAYWPWLIVSALTMGGACFLLLTGQLSALALAVVLSVIGIFCAYQILAISLACTFVEARMVGLATACANMIIMVFGYVFHILIGKRIAFGEQMLWQTAYVYTQALMVIPIGLFIAALGYGGLAWHTKRRSARLGAEKELVTF